MINKFDGDGKTLSDSKIEELISDHCEKHNFTPLDAMKHWMVLGRRQWMKRFLAHSEFFKKTLTVPGDIAELGVFRGMGLFTWANLLESYCVGDRTKVVWGFDNWEGFTQFSPEDGEADDAAHKNIGEFSPKDFYQELLDAIKLFDQDRFIPQKPRIKLVKGPLEETAAQFVLDNPGVRFSLIHFDCDLYAPTKAALEAFWPVLSRGGIMLFDEYSIPQWPGETKAVDDFFADKPEIRIETLSWTNVPSGFVVKK
ncbi:TylF/MycF/NovP-related O-methyltransferase [Maridesulfovibrio frigidus]|uniref:TylF/MycF/NovP-related O-methyltransferase n=1 Tax=Maridesulfovibrio frigidus TaxID=340956 RepID=UPI000B220ADC|nr:TylF/MycF/NovP-related O-methyltransferase [Maridesulfovibrio frigidus]